MPKSAERKIRRQGGAQKYRSIKSGKTEHPERKRCSKCGRFLKHWEGDKECNACGSRFTGCTS